MRRFVLSVSTAVCLTVGLSFMLAAEATVKTDFMAEAATANAAEIALSNLALQRAQNESVKQFAQQMVTDHTAAGQELSTLASGKNVTLPTDMDAKHRSLAEKLGSRTGSDFDRDYMKAMVDDHEKAVKLFQGEAGKGTDADAKAWAAKMLPALQGHLQQARSIYTSVRGLSSGGTSNSAGDDHSNMNSGANTNESAHQLELESTRQFERRQYPDQHEWKWKFER